MNGSFVCIYPIFSLSFTGSYLTSFKRLLHDGFMTGS